MNSFIITATALTALAATAYLRGRKARRYVVSVEEERCSGCGRCTGECKHHVLALAPRKEGKGQVAVVANPAACTACGHCTEKCGRKALQLVKRGYMYQS